MSPNPDNNAEPDDAKTPPASPYGPHPRGVDEAAGGADSSPFETEPTGERKQKADAERRAGRDDDTGGDVNESPRH